MPEPADLEEDSSTNVFLWILKKNYFTEHFQATASDTWTLTLKILILKKLFHLNQYSRHTKFDE